MIEMAESKKSGIKGEAAASVNVLTEMPVKEQKQDREAGKIPAAYSREQLLTSDRYRNRRDLISAILEDGKSYTLAEVDKKIEEFMKGKVK